jgi:hypothetical protein
VILANSNRLVGCPKNSVDRTADLFRSPEFFKGVEASTC